MLKQLQNSVYRRLDQLIKVYPNPAANLIASKFIQQAFKFQEACNIDRVAIVPASLMLALKLLNSLHDFREMTRLTYEIVKRQRNKDKSPRDQLHLTRLIQQVKEQQVLILIRIGFRLDFQLPALMSAETYQASLYNRLVNACFRMQICLSESVDEISRVCRKLSLVLKEQLQEWDSEQSETYLRLQQRLKQREFRQLITS